GLLPALGQEGGALAAALAPHHEPGLAEVDVRQVERGGLRPPERRAGEHRYECGVAGAACGPGVGGAAWKSARSSSELTWRPAGSRWPRAPARSAERASASGEMNPSRQHSRRTPRS